MQEMTSKVPSNIQELDGDAPGVDSEAIGIKRPGLTLGVLG